MSEEKAPIKIKNFKNAMSHLFSEATTLKTEDIDFSNNSVVVITAAGIIYGTTCIDLSTYKSMDDKIFSTLYDKAVEMTAPEVNRYCLILKDVTLVLSDSFKQSFKTLFVFPEDIIAITLADVSNI